MSHAEQELINDHAFNEENITQDSKADAVTAVALVFLTVAIAVYWVAGQ